MGQMKFIFVLLLVYLIIILSGFFWIFIHPGQIRKSCVAEVKINKDQISSGAALNNLYRICLAKHGLNPENLINE